MAAARQWARHLVYAWIGIAIVALAAAQACWANAPAVTSPDIALNNLLDQARTAVPAACAGSNADRLTQILCAHRIRIGVRTDYPQFGERQGGVWHGYEIELARAIAEKLGVAVQFVPVTPADRIPALVAGQVDAVIATMGYTARRAEVVRFISPNYYESETVLIGARDEHIANWHDVSGRSVCVTVGNNSNWEIAAHGARLMLFGSPNQLLDGLASGECEIIAQDSSFFARALKNPAFAAEYNIKLGFAPVPWGIAVAPSGAAHLARALSLITQIFLRDGALIKMARAHDIATGFLVRQQTLWRGQCNTASGSTDPACILAPAQSDTVPTSFAPEVNAIQTWLATKLGIVLSLPMLETQRSWSLLQAGVINSLILVAGTIAATLLFALTVGAVLGFRLRLLAWPTRMLVIALQSSPPIMTLIIAAAVLKEVTEFTPTTVIIAAIAALGLINGANAGQAISETIVAIRAQASAKSRTAVELFVLGVSQSAKQLEAFLINAAKSTPVASFIGTPELLNQLTDIGSVSTNRASIYWLLLIFYLLVVAVVVRFSASLRWFLQRQGRIS